MTESRIIDLRHLSAVLALMSGEPDATVMNLAGLEADKFVHWSQRHQVGGLTYLLLEDFAARSPVQRGLITGLRACYVEQWARSERLRSSLIDLADVFAAIDEPFIVLKGLPLAQRYYGSYERRATGDLDVLVPRAHAHRIADALASNGLSRVSPRYGVDSADYDHVHHVEFTLGETSVELHHALRVHATFRIDETRLWDDAVAVDLQGARYRTLSDEHALLLHLLGFHTDVQIGQVNARWFVDLHQMLLRASSGMSWTDFFEARRADGTYKICVNSLTAFVVLTKSDELFPSLSLALAARTRDIVLRPDRFAYLDLLGAASLVARKTWPLRQYDGGFVNAASWWLSGLPRRIAAKPKAFAGDMTAHVERSPWESAGRLRSESRLEREFGVDPTTLQEATLRFGSLLVRVRYQHAEHFEAIEELYRLRPVAPHALPAPVANPDAAADLLLHVFSRDLSELPIPPSTLRPFVRRPLERLLEIHEGAAHAWVDDSSDPIEAFIAIDRTAEARAVLLHSLMVVINRILSAQQRYHVHAAAVGGRDSAALFIGGKGAGKSTISLSLGRSGATVFSEDHVVLRQADGRFLVSGCDARMHLTEQSERHFFATPVEGALIQSAGVSKRQIDMARIIACRPYEEVEVTALFFPEVGQEFSLRPLSKDEAVARLLAPLTERHRFVDDADQAAFLDVFCRLVESCPTWELTLSPNLDDLGELARFLEIPAHTSRLDVAAASMEIRGKTAAG